MSRAHQILQDQPTESQSGLGTLDVEHRRSDFSLDGPLFATDEAAAYLRYRGKHRLRSLYRFLAQKGIPTSRRSARAILIAKADIDRALAIGRKRA